MLNSMLVMLEREAFFAEIGPEKTEEFLRHIVSLSWKYDFNRGEIMEGICYYCWDRGTDVRQGICRDCRAADSIGIELDDAEVLPPRDAALSYGFIDSETIRDLLDFLPEQLTRDLDAWDMRRLPGDCVDSHLQQIFVDSAWGVEYLPGRRQRKGMTVLMIEVLAHPYPGVVRRLRRYASMLSDSLHRRGCVGGRPPSIVPVLIYNGAPAWTPQPCTDEWSGFEYTFIDVGRMPPGVARSHEPVAALSSTRTAIDRTEVYW